MKNLTITLVTLVFCATAASAATARSDLVALRDYAKRAVARCPDATIQLTPIPEGGPRNFAVYDLRIGSSDENCRSRRILLHSPVTQQVLIGTVVLLPQDNRPVQVRVAEQASQMLNRNVTANVTPFPLPDGLRSTGIVKQTPFGPFTYRAYVDASQQFLIIGTRGNLNIDPAKTLRETLGVENAARRGNARAKVEIIELSDFQCPTCARAHKKLEPFLKKHLGNVNYLRLDLPLFETHDWAFSAALAARALQKVAPQRYWEFVDLVFENQETIGKMKFDHFFRDFCTDRDIDLRKVESVYRSPEEKRLLLEQVSRAFDAGIMATPTFIINGQLMGFGPDGNFVYEAIRKAVAK
ncbi:MAG TPA: thioredoxin domain-containing protein [Thermoanaerobaculia bacterium]|nr:thioredoxin domain-containing protein [Thermoanaerobaculia bacterium]